MAKKNQDNKRPVAVLFSLVAAMTVGAVVLMTLDKKGPSEGAYSLSSYLRLDPVKNVVSHQAQTQFSQWNRIEVYYSLTSAGNAVELPVLAELVKANATGYHFVICNGQGGLDGAIEKAGLWNNQQSCNGKDGVIRVCVIGGTLESPVTDSQIRRTKSLIDSLSREFGISARQITFPGNWQL